MEVNRLFILCLTVVGALYLLIIRGTGCQEVEYHEQTNRARFQADSDKAAADLERAKLEQQRIWAKKGSP